MVNENNNVESAPLLTEMERQDTAERPNDGPPKSSPTTTTVTTDDHPDAPLGNTASQRRERNRDRDGELEIEEDSSASTPRFMQDESSWKRWKWVPYPVRRFSKAVARWSRGPPNPKVWKIQPLLPRIQQFPLWLVEKYLPKRRHRYTAVFLYVAIWAVTFTLVKRQETFATEIAGWGVPSDIGCGATYWGAANRCGLNGADCRPFNNSGFPFRCTANCESYQVLNPRAVGDQEILYRSFVIGGPKDDGNGEMYYRGDSHICPAAIHAGVVSDASGGCGVVKLVGQQQEYDSSRRNGIESIGFDSYFPLAFTFEPDITCTARDMRWDLLAVSVVFSSVLSLFTSSAALFFFTNFIGLFWHVGMASDPPRISSIAGLASNILGKFLPAMFVAWVMYDKMGVRRTLNGLTAQIEKTVLWLGACWVGTLTNYTLRFIPISRLTAHDLQQQPGAQAALAIIIIILVCIVVVQIWFFQQEGRFLKYISLYGLFVAGIIIALVLPGLSLRIHHYILALLLLPGTSMQTRPSLLYQGLLIGLFINGIARWGFDPVLETPAALQGDAQHNSALPDVLQPVIELGEALWTINLTWAAPDAPRYDGISVLVNDVERFRTYFDDNIAGEESFLWERETGLDLNEYFRFGYMEGSSTWDYSKAGVWTAEGEWVEMAPGPSKVRARDLDGIDEPIKRTKRQV